MKCWNCVEQNEQHQRDLWEAIRREDYKRQVRLASRFVVPEEYPFEAWLLHRVLHGLDTLDYLLGIESWRGSLSFVLEHVGVLDAPFDGGIIHWRWDPWNSVMRRLYRDMRAEMAQCSAA